MSQLRSTKDLKEIIGKARKVNFNSTFQDQSNNIEEVQSSSDDEKTYEMRFHKKG